MSERSAAEVVSFWREAGPDKWWEKDDAFDHLVRSRFLPLHEAAARGEVAAWEDSPEGALALVILLDQFPRNMFRGSPHAFATDPLAQAVAERAIARGFDAATDAEMRMFFYMPFMHSEALAHQHRCVALMAAMADGGSGKICRDSPRHHREIRTLPASKPRTRPPDHAGGTGILRRRRVRGLNEAAQPPYPHIIGLEGGGTVGNLHINRGDVAMSASENHSRSAAEIPVLIVGGGLVGLSAAMFLAQHGVASVVIERLRGVSALPRAAHFHLRTFELFRAAGIEDDVRRQSEREFTPEGAIVALESLAGKQIAAFIPSLNEGVEALSPSRRLFITQPGLEPILRTRAERAGAQVSSTAPNSSGWTQDRDGVTATVRDVDSGVERRLRAKYMIGADGPHSKTRELLEIPFDGRGVFSNSITIYFHADVGKLMSGRNLSVMYIINPTLSGFIRLDKDNQAGFLVVNTVGDTSRPETANAAGDTSETRLLELLRAGIGCPTCR